MKNCFGPGATKCAACLALAGFALTAHAANVFTFDADTLGTSTQFTDTVGGISATFSSPSDPGGFQIQPTIFQALNGNVLGDPGPAGASGIPLIVTFNQDLSAIAAVFATADFGPASPFTLTAFLGNTQVGSVTQTGFVPAGFTFPEGEIAFGGSPFNRVVFSSPAPDFAVDQLAVAPTPEPGSIWLFGFGLVGVALLLRRKTAGGVSALAICALLSAPSPGSAQTTVIPPPSPSASTVPAIGDVNPYGVLFVPNSVPVDGLLRPGNILVSNFNNVQNLQGTGRTIVQITPQGQQSLFFTSTGNNVTGLTAAFGILNNGTVIAGYLPTLDGTPATALPGGLLFLNRAGVFTGGYTNSTLLSGPWGMAVFDQGNGSAFVFVSSVLNGNVLRLHLNYTSGNPVVDQTPVAIGGYGHRLDPAALVVGPSGLAYDAAHDLLYVASETDSSIYTISSASTRTSSAGTGTLLINDFVHLHGPLGMALTPNGHLLVANSDGANVDPNQPSELVEYTTAGQFLTQFSIDPNNGGAFGVAIQNIGWGTIRVAAVNDNQITLNMWTTVVH
jgi:hypothetical protein